ncbi:MAG TPA: sugar phosphate nucleotidyltransferase [Candidatus Woesebacteria bacterium]|nr:sugar phosphate nucleotidyltransferase [Candidatus Woesebacteria bacterium]HNS65124.1 sugar phosphate nucleotidyltransferase [Candidatus Woesebacteria bacterium]
MNQNSHVYAVILAGGGGTRLWPKSRNDTPKQFLKLMGKHTMLQITAQRLNSFIPWEKMVVVTNQKYSKRVGELLPELPKNNIILEPEKKDTALAMLVGSIFAHNLDPKAVVVNAAADHVVQDESEFIRVMKAAADVAAENEFLVTVGISPKFASTAFGYIKISDSIRQSSRAASLFKVESFTEKPNETTARAFLATGKYFWNANMYVWATQTIITAFQQLQPEIWKSAKALVGKSIDDFTKSLESIYASVEPISIDYAISEKADNLVLVPGDFGWDDIGEWLVVYNLGQKDLAGNVIISDGDQDRLPTLSVESQNNLIHSNGRLVALLGVRDMIIVDTPDIVMIAPKSRSQDVKKLVERLKEEKRSEYL